MQKERLLVLLPLIGLVVLVITLYIPQIAGSLGYSGRFAALSDLTFMDKTTVLLTFMLASFAALEGYSTFKRASMEEKRHKIEDARNELEKAYGPLYSLLNKTAKTEETTLWLDSQEMQKIDEIIATYPFMFPNKICELWQQKIRNCGYMLETSELDSSKNDSHFDVYLELRNLINMEYADRVLNYRKLLGK